MNDELLTKMAVVIDAKIGVSNVILPCVYQETVFVFVAGMRNLFDLSLPSHDAHLKGPCEKA